MRLGTFQVSSTSPQHMIQGELRHGVNFYKMTLILANFKHMIKCSLFCCSSLFVKYIVHLLFLSFCWFFLALQISQRSVHNVSDKLFCLLLHSIEESLCQALIFKFNQSLFLLDLSRLFFEFFYLFHICNNFVDLLVVQLFSLTVFLSFRRFFLSDLCGQFNCSLLLGILFLFTTSIVRNNVHFRMHQV